MFNLDIVNSAGLTLFFIGFLIRHVGKRALGSSYSYGLRTLPKQRLVTTGIYRRMRHPINLAAIMYSLGLPIVFSSLYGFLVMILMIPLIFYRIRIEERMLIERFGKDYRDYMRRSKRLIPFVF